MGIKDFHHAPEWRALKKTVAGTWNKTPAENILKLRKWLDNFTDERKFFVIAHLFSGIGFQVRIASHPAVKELLDDIHLVRRGKVTNLQYMKILGKNVLK